jgi:hypothetical protein
MCQYHVSVGHQTHLQSELSVLHTGNSYSENMLDVMVIFHSLWRPDNTLTR